MVKLVNFMCFITTTKRKKKQDSSVEKCPGISGTALCESLLFRVILGVTSNTSFLMVHMLLYAVGTP